MPVLASVFFVAMVTLLGALYVPAQEAQRNTAVADVGATSLLAYRESVINYLNGNPGYSGTVPDSSLTFIWGYVRDPRWSNVVSGGTLYVYEVVAKSPNTSLVLEKLYRKTASSFMVGRNASGLLVSANGFSTGITVPAAVPNGALVFVGK
ncbi:type IV pilus biogenesis protein PilM [Polaromonas aquatica]|uniref:Type IV pilus biogenesis protein PilM n=1 Tax=Polaromonas aquatica TaxID=332657 RepID=A0ABW1TWB7_9BURK